MSPAPSDPASRELLQDLTGLSVRLGRQPMLVQGGGGNTSVKHAGRLWVKASGVWLSEAQEAGAFVSLDLDAVRAASARGEPEPAATQFLGPTRARPSIETPLHALMPHRFVAHVHSVNTLAWVCRVDAERQLTTRLAGLAWAWVPYVRPGVPLTLAVADRLSARPDVLALANHGLVVGGDSAEGCERLLDEVERRVACATSPPAHADVERLEKLATSGGWRLPAYLDCHAAALDARACRQAASGALYPDHVVFLGERLPVLSPGEELPALDAAYRSRHGSPPAAVLVEGAGALVAPGSGRGVDEMLRCLSLVLARVSEDAPLAFLSKEAVGELTGWEAEKFRQQRDRQP
ncbi:MAG: class II aldolase [Candidatus Wallbacteria bacterium]|nr:class II aldolase [Candidatus Wallbacteria bacterium]